MKQSNNKTIGSCSSRGCPKSGIKIHNSNSNSNSLSPFENTLSLPIMHYSNNVNDQQEFYNKIKNQNKHTGVRIETSKNEYREDPFENINPFSNPTGEKDLVDIKYNKQGYENLDLNIDNYSREDLFNLFGINTSNLSEEVMKETKKIVLKTHPDKSKLEPKYFLFFSKAYKRLYGIYEYQNKSSNKVENNSEYYETEKTQILNTMFKKTTDLKDSKNFNKWFNDAFEKHRIEDPNEKGYGDWLKSNEGVIDVGNVSRTNMASEFEKQKKIVQSVAVYNGLNEPFSDTFGGSALINASDNYSSGLFSSDNGFTDLRQAYAESIIPVTEDDYNKMQKFRNLDEYNKHRNSVNVSPLDKEESMRKLYEQNKQTDEESTARAFYLAKESEKIQKKQESFWSTLKQLTNT